MVAHDSTMEIELVVGCSSDSTTVHHQRDRWRITVVLEDPRETRELEEDDAAGTKCSRTPSQSVATFRKLEDVVIGAVDRRDQIVRSVLRQVEESPLIEPRLRKTAGFFLSRCPIVWVGFVGRNGPTGRAEWGDQTARSTADVEEVTRIGPPGSEC